MRWVPGQSAGVTRKPLLLLLSWLGLYATASGFTHSCTVKLDVPAQVRTFDLQDVQCCSPAEPCVLRLSTPGPRTGLGTVWLLPCLAAMSAQEPQIQCRSLTKQTCGLKVFYNTSYPGLPDSRTWGVDVGVLPRHGPVPGGEVLPYAADAFNRSDKSYNSTLWPLLYFHGGPGCAVLLEDPVIVGVNFPDAPHEATQVGAACSS